MALLRIHELEDPSHRVIKPVSLNCSPVAPRGEVYYPSGAKETPFQRKHGRLTREETGLV